MLNSHESAVLPFTWPSSQDVRKSRASVCGRRRDLPGGRGRHCLFAWSTAALGQSRRRTLQTAYASRDAKTTHADNPPGDAVVRMSGGPRRRPLTWRRLQRWIRLDLCHESSVPTRTALRRVRLRFPIGPAGSLDTPFEMDESRSGARTRGRRMAVLSPSIGYAT